MNKVYALVMITGNEETTALGIEPVGIYSTLELAFEYVEKLEKAAPNIKEEYIFEIFEYSLDEEPLILSFFKIEKEQQTIKEEAIQELVIELMKQGLIDQLIGEDGHFYYKLTDKGEERSKNIPKT